MFKVGNVYQYIGSDRFLTVYDMQERYLLTGDKIVCSKTDAEWCDAYITSGEEVFFPIGSCDKFVDLGAQ